MSIRDSVLVIPQSRSQDVRAVVDELKARNSTRHSLQPVVHRPWGTYETTDAGARFQTKRIVVKPGGQLSLQMHNHRSEHWIVVTSTALVTIDGVEKIVGENQSAYIPAGAQHRLANPGKVPLHLIEVQCGPYLGEDDIVRFEDIYARVGLIFCSSAIPSHSVRTRSRPQVTALQPSSVRAGPGSPVTAPVAAPLPNRVASRPK